MTSLLTSTTRFPQTIYYPSLMVNLQLRFDEGSLSIGSPRSAEDLGGGNARLSAGSLGVEDGTPIVFQPGRSDDDLSHILNILPRSASVQLPAYRQAGTFDVELEFKDLPLDPRTIRAMKVIIHLDAVAAGDFGEGMTRTPAPTGRRASIVEATEDNLLIAGLADVVSTSHSDSGATVRFSGRDLRGILLDLTISPKTLESIDLSRPIDEVVRHIMHDLHPLGAEVRVVVDGSEWPGGQVPTPYTLDDATRVNLDALGTSLRAPVEGEAQKLNFWDLITGYCFLVGGVPYFVGSALHIRPARTLFDARKQFDPAVGTPFADGQPRNVQPPAVEEPEQLTFRRLTFGRDIQELNFERKLAGVKVPVVEVVSYDTGGDVRGEGRLLKAQWPPSTEPEARTTSVPPSGKAAQTDVIRINAPGVKSKGKLLEIAKDLYQEIGRQELGGSVKTRNLASFGGGNQDPDLLHLRPGDPVEFRVDASGLGVFPPPISELTNEENRSFEEQVAAVAERVGDENLARALVTANRSQDSRLQKVFRTANVRFDWDKDSGVKIAFDFQNFVEARYAVEDVVAARPVGFGIA